MVVANNEIDGDKKYTSNAGNFDGHADTAVQSGRIAQWSASVASCKATRCRHRASAHAALPQRLPWSTILNETIKTLTKHNFYLAFSR
jgi:hypothetical protein